MSTDKPTDKSLPIYAAELRDALAFALAVCPKPDERPSLSFVALVPDPSQRRFLVTARSGGAWVGAYVEGEGMHRLALSHEGAKLALKHLKHACSTWENPRLVPDEIARLVWYVTAEAASHPMAVDLLEHLPRWDISTRRRPELFPAGWEAPIVRGSMTATPAEYSSDVLMLGKFWRGTRARWWIDAQSEFCRVEFQRGDRLVAYAVAVPSGRTAGVATADPRQHPLPHAGPAPLSAEPAAPTDRAASATPGVEGGVGDATAEPVEAIDPDAFEVPVDLSDALLAALRLASAYRAAAGKHELASWTNHTERFEPEFEAAGKAFWGALEQLGDADRALCTQIGSDAGLLARVLEARAGGAPEPAPPTTAAAAWRVDRDDGTTRVTIIEGAEAECRDGFDAAVKQLRAGENAFLLRPDGTIARHQHMRGGARTPKKKAPPKGKRGEARP